MKKTILFDLDGTLTDSGEGIINCALLTLEHFGLPLPTREELRFFVGPPLGGSFLKLGIPEDRVPEAIRYYRSHYTVTGIHENSLYPGIEELLQALQAQGHKLYVATSKPEFMAKGILEDFGLAKYFTMICGASTDTHRNTKEAVIAHLMERNPDAKSIIMIGDTIFDVEGAASLGIPTIGVSWGYGNVPDMISAGAIAIADSTQELYQLLNP